MFPRTPHEEADAGRVGVPIPVATRRPIVTWTILAVNVALWLLTLVRGGANNVDVLVEFGAMQADLIVAGEYWRLFTATLLHADLIHLGLNCVALLIFGHQLEPLFGRTRFLLVYLLAGLGGSVASYAFNISLTPNSIGVGASGAIFGILGGLVAFLALNRDRLGAMGRQHLTALLVIAAINLAFGLTFAGVDNYAHGGGFVAGLLIGLAYSPDYRPVLNIFGELEGVVDANSVLRRSWVLPAAVLTLIAGVMWGDRNVGESPISYLRQAEEYRISQDFGEAIEAIDRAIEIEPHSGQIYLERARLMLAMGNMRRAESDLGRALRLGLPPSDRQGALELLVQLRSRR